MDEEKVVPGPQECRPEEGQDMQKIQLQYSVASATVRYAKV